MNIFVLDNNLSKSVEYHIDAHVIKMPLEAAQIISTTLAIDHTLGYMPRALTRAESVAIREKRQGWPFYKPTHINHPCSIWARTSNDNFNYLVEYCLQLNREKLHRWPEKPGHKSAELIEDFVNGWWPTHLACGATKMTPFAQAMPEDYKESDAVSAYRTYYYCEKQYNKAGKHMAIWTNRKPPQWWLEVL